MGEAGEFVSSFEEADALFEHIGGGVRDPAVDVPEFFEGEKVGGVLGILEGESGRFINRDCT